MCLKLGFSQVKRKVEIEVMQEQYLRGMKWQKTEDNCNEEIRSLYSSPNIITMIKSRRVWWAWHAAHTGTLFES